ncbi:unnamed protein product [Anisakis simplex]|uniref:CRAL-TRIO domain-containing protein n=1 Tax=Anisakis simplex TaxID=6269 RepID=A0A0M3IZ69_ANISI|nr:unnamed protein product [Anisakis simplex]
MESNLQAVSPISADERHAITILRSRLQETMPEGIPDDLNTDFNLNRWIRGYDHDIDRILQINQSVFEAFPEYVASRRAAGFDVSDHMERFFEMPSIKPYLPFIAASRLGDRIWSDQHNAFLFVERAWSQPKEFVKALKCSDYMMHCFGYSELLLQYILQREKIQKADKGAVQFIVIFDMSDVNISDYLNPISTHMKLWQLRSDMWQDWYVVLRLFIDGKMVDGYNAIEQKFGF